MLNLTEEQILNCLRGNETEKTQQQLDTACAEYPMAQALYNLFKLILHTQDNQGMITVADAKELATASGATVMLLLGEINRLLAQLQTADETPGYFNAKHDPEKFNTFGGNIHKLH